MIMQIINAMRCYQDSLHLHFLKASQCRLFSFASSQTNEDETTKLGNKLGDIVENDTAPQTEFPHKKVDSGTTDVPKSVKRRKTCSKRTKVSDSDSDTESDLSREDLVKLLAKKEEIVKKKHAEMEIMKDKAMKTFAENDNFIERTKLEAENSKKFAIHSFTKSLLDVADNLGRASSVVKDRFTKVDTSEDPAGALPFLKTLLEGVKMTEKQRTEVFRKFGLERYDPMNEQLDPNRHNAVLQVPDQSKPPNTVAVVMNPIISPTNTLLQRARWHMICIHPLFINIPRYQIPKYFTISCYFAHNLSSNLAIQNNANNSYTSQDWAKMISTQITNCKNAQQLNQIYAHVIRIHMLYHYSAPFYWNIIIRAYTNFCSPSKALYVSRAMSRAGVYPDTYTLPVVLKAVSQKNEISIVRQLHTVAMKHGLQTNLFCESGFISLYAKAGEFDNALKLFDESPERSLGSWNAVLGGLSQGGCAREVMDMFLELKRSGLEPDDVTMVSVTSACGSLGNLSLALQLHKCVFQAKSLDKSDVLMSNSLIDMYGKCGRMDLAFRVFSRMHERNISSWTSLIVGYATHGHVHDALECFHGMREAHVTPNAVTFVGVLSACVHGGLVQEGKHYFEMMKNEYKIDPWLQHYGCMVDLLGRCGLLEEAIEMVEKMPMEANVVIWGCLMGACEKHGNVKIGERVARHLREMEPWNDGVYVVMSNIYATNGLWEDVARMRRIMKERKLEKVPGYSLGA